MAATTETVECKFVAKEGTDGPFLAVELLNVVPVMLTGLKLHLNLNGNPDFDQAADIARELNRRVGSISVVRFTSLSGLTK